MIFLLLLMLVGKCRCEDDFGFTEKYCSAGVTNCCYGPNSEFQFAYEASQPEDRSMRSILMQLTGRC